MPLVRLLYTSKIAFDPRDRAPMDAILHTARSFNLTHDITGLLACRNGEFLQAIEGPRKIILSLYQSILRDARHSDVQLLHFSEVSARSFYRWSMGSIQESDVPKNINLYFGGGTEFTFDTMRSDHAMSFLLYCAQRDLIAA